MNSKKGSKVIITVFVILLICTGFAIQHFYGRINKEINSAKSFVELLYDKKMIDTSEDLDEIDYEVVKQLDGNKENYRVSSENFGFDLNSEYNVIGFTYNYKLKNEDNLLSEEEARKLAEKYISILSEEDYKFKKQIQEELSDGLSYYGYMFSRYKDGYPFYNDQIMIQIDKYSGYLTGYSNTTSQGTPEKIEINVELDGAKEIAIESFNSLNKDGVVDSNDILVAYADNKDKTRTELCYVITVSGKDVDDKDVKWKFFITTDTGEVINSTRDTVSKSGSVN